MYGTARRRPSRFSNPDNENMNNFILLVQHVNIGYITGGYHDYYSCRYYY